MLKNCCTAFVFLLIAKIPFSQNLVSNPGFEIYSALPTGVAQYNLAIGWDNCNGGGSPDYFSTLGSGQVQLPACFIGTVNPNSGDGCMGAALYYNSPPDFREYISSQLLAPLVTGQTYNVILNVTNGITAGFYGGGGIDKISVAFSLSPLTQPGNGPISYTPQVTNASIFYSHTWQQISMQFVAADAYQYMTIGNFFPDASTTYQQFDPCSSFGAYYFFDDLVVEQANVAPVAIFTAPNQICPGTCTDFTNLSLNATSYQWIFTGANPSVSVDANPTNICYNSPGNYPVQLIASNSVTSDTLTLANYITVHPHPAPQGILQSGDTLFANQGAVSYQWYQSGSMIPGATNYYYIATQSGNYNVVATDVNGCEVEAAIFDIIAYVNPVLSANETLTTFPNPVQDMLTILYSSGVTGADVVIYNVHGEKIHSVEASKLRVIDCSEFAAGLYILELKDSDKIFHHKFLKQ